MKKELLKAAVFCLIGMVLFFTPILYKNNFTVLFGGTYHKLL